MSESDPEQERREITVESAEDLPPGKIVPASAVITADAVVAGEEAVGYRQNPQGGWDSERFKAVQRASAAAHRQREEAEEARYRREQGAKDREQNRYLERIALGLAALILVGTLGFGATVAVDADSDAHTSS